MNHETRTTECLLDDPLEFVEFVLEFDDAHDFEQLGDAGAAEEAAAVAVAVAPPPPRAPAAAAAVAARSAPESEPSPGSEPPTPWHPTWRPEAELQLTEADWRAFAELFGRTAVALECETHALLDPVVRPPAAPAPAMPPRATPAPTTPAHVAPTPAMPPRREPPTVREHLPTRARAPKAAAPEILRFTRSERLLHWAIAGPFLACYLSALVLWLFYTDERTIMREVFGWLHRLGGVLMILFPALVAVRHWRDYRVHLENIKEAFVWTRRDIRWLFLMGPAAINKELELPDQDKFNAAEKINFINVFLTYPLYIATGLMIWMPGVAFWPWAMHVLMAATATPLLAGHIFMATVNPETRVGLSGMVTGRVNREWAKHHYRDWYRRKFEQPGGQDTDAPSPHGARLGVSSASS